MVDINEVMRDFQRFTGDGKPGEPVGSPLPIGDPSSGAFTLKKSDFRAWAAEVEQTALSGPEGPQGAAGADGEGLPDFAIATSNIDTLTKSGFYNVSSNATGMPIAGADARLIHVAKNVDEWSQVLFVTADLVFFREKDNSANPASAWRRSLIVETDGTEGQILQWIGGLPKWQANTSGGVLIISDQKTIGTAGSYYAATSWVKHDITSEDYNTIVGASVDIVNHTVTLPAGTYIVSGDGPTNYKGNFALAKLRDITNSNDPATSKNSMSHSSFNSADTMSFLGVFTLAGTAILELQQWRGTAGAIVASGYHTEKYMELMFEKIG